MTLLELVDAYRDILKRSGRAAADRFLGEVGAHPAIRRAIQSNFTDNGRCVCG
jgi:hypothetical protein